MLYGKVETVWPLPLPVEVAGLLLELEPVEELPAGAAQVVRLAPVWNGSAFAKSVRTIDIIITVDRMTAATIEPVITMANCMS